MIPLIVDSGRREVRPGAFFIDYFGGLGEKNEINGSKDAKRFKPDAG